MYISTFLPLSLLASLSIAQTSYAPNTSVCAAQPVLEACLASTEAIATGCAATDYGCLCQKWTDVVTCFQQCPNDSRYASIYSEQQTYCSEATIYSTSTSSLTSARSSSVVAATTSDTITSASPATSATGSSAGTATASSTSSSASGNAAMKGAWINAGGALAAAAGVAGALL